jgi:transposase
MSPEERLVFHKANSGPLMEGLEKWLDEQIDEKKVEPNSGLGQAIFYMKNHWTELVQFLHVSGAPLDNTICERALKKAILHRKGSLFYKTQNGTQVGDLFMSLIYTCERCGADPFDYLVELQKHIAELAGNPGSWMPWNYRATIEQGRASPTSH